VIVVFYFHSSICAMGCAWSQPPSTETNGRPEIDDKKQYLWYLLYVFAPENTDSKTATGKCGCAVPPSGCCACYTCP